MIKFIHKNILNPCQVEDNSASSEGDSKAFNVAMLILPFEKNLTFVSVNFHVFTLHVWYFLLY